MALDVALLQFPQITEIAQFAFDTGDISFGEAENKQISINYGGNIEQINIRRRSIQFTIRGALETDVVALDQVREDNIRAMIARQDLGVDFNVAGIQIYKGYLADVTPSGSITVEGTEILESLQLTYNARRWS